MTSLKPNANARYGLLFLLCSLLPIAAHAAPVVGTITHLGGILFVTRADGSSKLLSVKSEVLEGDILKTQKDTYARIKFSDGGEVVLRPETIFKISSYRYTPDVPGTVQKSNDSAIMSLIKGGMRSVTGLIGKRDPSRFKVQTSTATIGIRGTHFGALLCDNDCGAVPTVTGQPPANGLYTDTVSGMTTITNQAGTIEVPAGSFSYTASPTVPPVIVPPSKGIQVTMPPAISNNNDSGKGLGKEKSNACVVGG